MSEIKDFKALKNKLIEEKSIEEAETEEIVKVVQKIVGDDIVLRNDAIMLQVFLTDTFSKINKESTDISQIVENAQRQLEKIQKSPQYENVKNGYDSQQITQNNNELNINENIEKLFDNYDKLTEQQKMEVAEVIFGKELGKKINGILNELDKGKSPKDVADAFGIDMKRIEAICALAKENGNTRARFYNKTNKILIDLGDNYNGLSEKEKKDELKKSIEKNVPTEEVENWLEFFKLPDMQNLLKSERNLEEITEGLNAIFCKTIGKQKNELQVEGNSKRTIKGFWTNIKQKIFSGPKGLKEKLFGKKEQNIEKDVAQESIIQEPTNLDSIIKALVTQSKGQISEEELSLTLETLTDIMSEEIGFFTKEISSLSVISISERISKEIENKAEIAQYLESFNDYKTIETMVKHIEQLSNDRINSDVDAGRTITVGDETWGTYVITKFEQECENKGYNTEFFDFLDTIDPRSGKIDLSKLLENTKNEIYPGKELTDADAQSLGEQAGIEEIDISALESLYEFAENPEATMEGLEAETMEEGDPEKVEESAEPESREDDEEQAKSAKAEEEARKAEEERQAQEKAKQDAEEKKRAEAERVAAEEKKKQEQQETENKSTALVEYRRPGFFARVKNFFKSIKSQGIRGAFAESFMTKEWAYEKEDIADNNSEHKVANTEEQNLSHETAKQTQQKAVEVKQNLQEQGATKDIAEKIGEDLAANNTSLNAVEGKDDIKNSNANEHPNNSEKYSSAKTNDWLTTNPEYMKKSNEVGKNAGKKLSEVSKTTDKTLDNLTNASQNKDDGR